MKPTLTLVTLLGISAASGAHAASLSLVRNFSIPGVYTVYLDGAPQNGAFNTIIFDAVPHGLSVFTNVVTGQTGGLPRPPGQAFTYRNRVLDADPAEGIVPGALGWTMVGLVNSSSQLAFTGGPIGQHISTADQPGGRLFLANLNLPTGSAGIKVQGVNGSGNLVFELDSSTVLDPEPTGLVLAGMMAIALTALRRNVGRLMS